MREVLKIITVGVTPRRLAAARRALQRQRDKCPLFAAEIAAGQPTPEERILRWDELRIEMTRGMRRFIAYQWRKARKMLREMPLDEQRELLNQWNNKKVGPHTSEYFADLVTNWKIDRGGGTG